MSSPKNFKRRKIDETHETSPSVSKPEENDKESKPSGAAKRKIIAIDENRLKSSNGEEVMMVLNLMYNTLNSKDNISALVLESNIGKLRAILDFFAETIDKFNAEETETASVYLKKCVSVLANCCYLNKEAAICISQPISVGVFREPASRFFNKCDTLLKNTHLSEDILASLTRLLANLCVRKETVHHVVAATSIVSSMSELISSPHSEIVNQCLRFFRLLESHSHYKACRSIPEKLGKLLVEKEDNKEKTKVWQLLKKLIQHNPEHTGKKLASSPECIASLWKIFIDGIDSDDREIIASLCRSSSEIRDRFGEQKYLHAVLELENDDTYREIKCRLIVAFAKDAWARFIILQDGGVDFLLDRLANSTDIKEQSSIMTGLVHFRHFSEGLLYLASVPLFQDTVIKFVNEFLEKTGKVCMPSKPIEIYRPTSPLLMEIEQAYKEKQEKEKDEEPLRLHKDFSSSWLGYDSPSTSSNRSSPLYSPQSSPQYSPVYSPTSSRSTSPVYEEISRAMSTSSLDSYRKNVRRRPPEKTEEEELKSIALGGLWLATWQSQDDPNLAMFKPQLVICLIRYLSLCSSPNLNLGRFLLRLAKSRERTHHLLKIGFHSIISNLLIYTPCMMEKSVPKCVRCRDVAGVGEEILRAFAENVDSSFGRSYLEGELNSGDENRRTRAAIAGLTMSRHLYDRKLKSPTPLSSVFGIQCSNIVFSRLRSLLLTHNDDNVQDENEASLAAQLIRAICCTVSEENFDKFKKRDDDDSESTHCLLGKYSAQETAHDGEEMLKIVDQEGTFIANVPMDKICSKCEYLQGMFSDGWSESRETAGRRVFVFDSDSEGCDSSTFVRFLHAAAGCRDKCSEMEDGDTVIHMLQLSDRYLCPSLSSYLCGNNGPALRILGGSHYPQLLVTSLSTSIHSRIFDISLLLLKRYTTSPDISEAMSSIAGNPFYIDLFLERIRARCCSHTKSEIGKKLSTN